MLQNADKNGDGKLDQQELAQLSESERARLQDYIDKDGTVDVNSAVDKIHEQGDHKPQMAPIDIDGDGKIDGYVVDLDGDGVIDGIIYKEDIHRVSEISGQAKESPVVKEWLVNHELGPNSEKWKVLNDLGKREMIELARSKVVEQQQDGSDMKNMEM